MRIFLAGASGVVGRRLVPLLLARGHLVWGTTRSEAKAAQLGDLGAIPVMVDVFDRQKLIEAVVTAAPQVVVHQLTDLPENLDPSKMQAAIAGNARIRDEGTRNLVEAARQAGVSRVVAQSIAWAYAAGPLPHGEDDRLDAKAEGARGITMGGVIALERQVLGAAGIEGVVLRYGQFYGPGTGVDTPAGTSPVHVDAAAHAALLAVDRGRAGIYNI
ncbi:MAG TPA: NAD(P)-dependent oxidoreductase, partial [Mesorhizobium sp.]